MSDWDNGDEDPEDRAARLADVTVTPWMLLGSTLGNARYSGLTIAELFDCFCEALDLAGFDAAVEAQANLKDILANHGK